MAHQMQLSFSGLPDSLLTFCGHAVYEVFSLQDVIDSGYQPRANKQYVTDSFYTSRGAISTKAIDTFLRMGFVCSCCGVAATHVLLIEASDTDCAHTAVVFEQDGEWNGLTVDHLLCKSYGGGNQQTNLRTACRNCNSLRGQHMSDEELTLVLSDLDKYVKPDIDQHVCRQMLTLYKQAKSGDRHAHKTWMKNKVHITKAVKGSVTAKRLNCTIKQFFAAATLTSTADVPAPVIHQYNQVQEPVTLLDKCKQWFRTVAAFAAVSC